MKKHDKHEKLDPKHKKAEKEKLDKAEKTPTSGPKKEKKPDVAGDYAKGKAGTEASPQKDRSDDDDDKEEDDPAVKPKTLVEPDPLTGDPLTGNPVVGVTPTKKKDIFKGPRYDAEGELIDAGEGVDERYDKDGKIIPPDQWDDHDGPYYDKDGNEVKIGEEVPDAEKQTQGYLYGIGVTAEVQYITLGTTNNSTGDSQLIGGSQIEVPEGCAVTLNDRESTIDDLKRGDLLVITGKPATEIKATR